MASKCHKCGQSKLIVEKGNENTTPVYMNQACSSCAKSPQYEAAREKMIDVLVKSHLNLQKVDKASYEKQLEVIKKENSSL